MGNTSSLSSMPAFPTEFQNEDGFLGMTYREWLAGLAMQGLAGDPEDFNDYKKLVEGLPDEKMEPYPKYLADTAIRYADALIQALEQDND